MSKKIYIEIIVDNKSSNTDKAYTYIAPYDYKGKIQLGSRVLVPFGQGNRLLEGIIINFKETIDIEESKLKYIHSIIDEAPVFGEKMLELGLWMKGMYMAQHIDVFKAIMPTGISKKVRTNIVLIQELREEDIEQLKDSNQKKIMRFLRSNPSCDLDTLKGVTRISNLSNYLQELKEKGFILIHENISSEVNKKYEKYVKKNRTEEEYMQLLADADVRGNKQKEILKYLINYEQDHISLKELMLKTKSSLTTIKALEEKRFIEIINKEVKRNAININIPKYEKAKLTNEQQCCVDSIYDGLVNRTHNKFP